MATKAWIAKAKLEPKFQCRRVRRCELCGRSRAVYRKAALSLRTLENLHDREHGQDESDS